MTLNTYRVHVIEKQWGGFEADFWTYADGASEAEAIAAVEARCSAWRADRVELFAEGAVKADVVPAAAELLEELERFGEVRQGGCVLKRRADQFVMYRERNVFDRHQLAACATDSIRLEAHWRGFVESRRA